ncbi:hypothetical protein N9H77_01625 [Porticoccaceae bacterium]|nr:hypothetical protein [Porticoccaceae bacterium]MDB4559090.1 hypothetical protein [bacterium]
MEELNIAEMISQYGFPIIAAVGLGYFVYYIWSWVTEKVDPVIEESHMTLIGLIDRIRMLDNDLIRLRTKLDMILQQQEMMKNEKDNNSNTTIDSDNES